MGENHSRRRVLQFGTVAALGGVAGCARLAADDTSGDSSSDDDSSNEPANETPLDSETDDAEESDPEPTESENDSDEADEEDDEEQDGEDDEGEDEEEIEKYDLEEPPGALADVPIPDDPGSYQYPIAGTGEADVRIEFFGGWKCRHTRRYIEERFPDFVETYVRSGTVDIEFHGVGYRDGTNFHGEDGPRAARAGLAAWYSQPDAFWSYFEYFYTNMETGDGWATGDRLRQLGAEAGVENHEQLARTVDSGAFEDQLQETMEHVEEIQVSAVPRIVVDGESYSPNADGEELVEALEAALEGDEADDS